MKVTLYIAASLDGFIAREDGSIEWLNIVEKEGEDYGYGDFVKKVDALAMGRKTYDYCRSLNVWPYENKDTFVFTNRQLSSARDNIFFVTIEAKNFVREVKNRGYGHLWLVGGGELIKQFTEADLIDEYIISFVPVILGSGLSLFPGISSEPKLKLIESKSFESGLVQSVYTRH